MLESHMKNEFSGALSERLEVLRVGATDVAGAAAEAVSVGVVWAEVLPQREGGDVLVWRNLRLRVLAVTRDQRLPDRAMVLTEEQA